MVQALFVLLFFLGDIVSQERQMPAHAMVHGVQVGSTALKEKVDPDCPGGRACRLEKVAGEKTNA